MEHLQEKPQRTTDQRLDQIEDQVRHLSTFTEALYGLMRELPDDIDRVRQKSARQLGFWQRQEDRETRRERQERRRWIFQLSLIPAFAAIVLNIIANILYDHFFR